MKYFKSCIAFISYCIIFHSNYIVHKYTNNYVFKNGQKHTREDVKHYQWLSLHCENRELQEIFCYICIYFCYTCIYLLNFCD